MPGATRSRPTLTEVTYTLQAVDNGVYAQMGPLGRPYSGAEHAKVYLDPDDWFNLGRPERIEVTVRRWSPTVEELQDLVR